MGAAKPVVDVVDYVDFLLKQPPMQRVQRIDQETALAVARMLRKIAEAHASEETSRLADRIWKLTLQLTAGDLAPRHKCREFLKTFRGVYLDRDSCDTALQLLEGLTPTELGRLRSQAVQDEYLHYRSRDGQAMYTLRQVKNPPRDDLSLRLFEAYCALKEAGCPTAAAFLARRLGWSSKRVETRLKPLKKGPCPSWPGSWRMDFWLSLDPSHKEIRPLPEEQPFEFRWNG